MSIAQKVIGLLKGVFGMAPTAGGGVTVTGGLTATGALSGTGLTIGGSTPTSIQFGAGALMARNQGSGVFTITTQTNDSSGFGIVLGGPASFYVRANSAQATTDIQQWQNSGGTPLSRVTPDGWIQNTPGRTRLSADVTNATTTFSNLTGLSQTLVAGRKYSGILRVLCSDSTAAEGIKFDFNGGGATMTSFAAGVVGNVQGATAGTTVSTSLAGAINFTAMNGTGTHYIDIAVTLVVNAAGTFIPRVAQNSHSTGTATAALGTYLWLEDTP